MTDNGVDFTSAGNFTFLPRAMLTTLNPPSAPDSGGVAVLLAGTGFSAVGTPSCSFGGVVVAADILSATEATCLTPALSSLSASSLFVSRLTPVSFSNNGVDFSDGLLFLVYPAPLVSSTIPSEGVTNGDSTKVVLTGINLVKNSSAPVDENTLACQLGHGGPSTSGRVINSTRAVCDVACGNYIGRTSIEVTLNGGAHWTAADGSFRCDPIPEVSAVFPPMGSTSGGTTLAVQGSGFVRSTSLRCLVGDGNTLIPATPAPALWISQSMVKCVAPPVPSGGGPTHAGVSVSNDGVHFSPPVSTAVFEYVLPLTISRVNPTFASIAGSDTPIVVTGTNFIDSLMSTCRFTSLMNDTSHGAGSPTSMTVASTFLSTTEMTCSVPGGVLQPGASLLTVSMNGVDFDEETGSSIELEALPEVSKVVPGRGMTGSTVTPVEVRTARASLTGDRKLQQPWQTNGGFAR